MDPEFELGFLPSLQERINKPEENMSSLLKEEYTINGSLLKEEEWSLWFTINSIIVKS